MTRRRLMSSGAALLALLAARPAALAQGARRLTALLLMADEVIA